MYRPPNREAGAIDNALKDARAQCSADDRAFAREDLRGAIMEGVVERVLPKMMTVAAIMAGLVPVLSSTGDSSEVMQRIAALMIGGMVSSTLLTLIVIPVLFAMIHGRFKPSGLETAAGGQDWQ